MSQYVCLTCWHVWKARKEEIKYRACPDCPSRRSALFSELVDAVEDAWRWIVDHDILSKDHRIGDWFFAPFDLIRSVQSLQKILRSAPSVPVGRPLVARVILQLARNYSPDTHGRINEYVEREIKRYQDKE